jgi:protein TonB
MRKAHMRLPPTILALVLAFSGAAAASNYSAPEHRVALRLTIAVSGTIDDCTIAAPSDRPDQDSLACDLLRRRGQAVVGGAAPLTLETALRWRGDTLTDESAWQPDDARVRFLPAPGTHWLVISDYPDELLHGASLPVIVRFTVSGSGRAENCRADGKSGNAALDAWTCRIVEGRRLFRRAADREGRPVRYKSDNRFFWAPGGIRVCDSGDACKP